MVSAIVALIAGTAIGWSLATAQYWLAALALALGIVGLALERSRLVDGRAAATATATTVSPSQTGWEDVHRELARARRHERPLAIVRLPGTDPTDASARAVAIAPYLRRIDRIWAEHGDVTVLLPDTDRTAAERLVDRLRARQPVAVGSSPAIATFPADGLTSGALLSALYGTPLPTVAVPIGVGRPVELSADGSVASADVIELRPHLAPDAPLTGRRESSS